MKSEKNETEKRKLSIDVVEKSHCSSTSNTEPEKKVIKLIDCAVNITDKKHNRVNTSIVTEIKLSASKDVAKDKIKKPSNYSESEAKDISSKDVLSEIKNAKNVEEKDSANNNSVEAKKNNEKSLSIIKEIASVDFEVLKNLVEDSQENTDDNIVIKDNDETEEVHNGYKGTDFEVSTRSEMENIIQEYIDATSDLFVCYNRTNNFGKPLEELDLTHCSIRWCDTYEGAKHPRFFQFDGVPLIIVGNYIMQCQFGDDKSRAKKLKRFEQCELMASDRKRRKSQGCTKKVDCPAIIFVKHCIKFPDYKITTDTHYLRGVASKKLREDLQSKPESVNTVVSIRGKLPDKSCHRNHVESQDKLKEPIDVEIINLINKLYSKKRSREEIVRRITDHVLNFMFYKKPPPDKNRKKYYPSRKDINNCITRLRLSMTLSEDEKKKIQEKIESLRDVIDGSNLIDFFYDPLGDNNAAVDNVFSDDEENTQKKNMKKWQDLKEIPNFTFIFQTSYQNQLLCRHGSIVFLTEINFPSRIRLPVLTMFVLLVQTNVDYQVVGIFVISRSYYEKGLEKLLIQLRDYNDRWCPEYFVIQPSTVIEEIVSDVFPSSKCFYNKESCKRKWDQFLSTPSTELLEKKEEISEILDNIANSYSEESLSTAANELEASESWINSPILQKWFSRKWQANSEKWICAYYPSDLILFNHLDGFREPMIDKYAALFQLNSKPNEVVKLMDGLKELSQEYFEKYKDTMQKTIVDPPVVPRYMEMFYHGVPFHLKPFIVDTMKEVVTSKYDVKLVNDSVFQLKNGEDVISLSFGSMNSYPCCLCRYWLINKIPCQHMLYTMCNVPGWSFSTLSPLYLRHNLISFDMGAVDIRPKCRDDVMKGVATQTVSNVSNRSSQTEEESFVISNEMTINEATEMVVDVIELTTKIHKLSKVFEPTFLKTFTKELHALSCKSIEKLQKSTNSVLVIKSNSGNTLARLPIPGETPTSESETSKTNFFKQTNTILSKHQAVQPNQSTNHENQTDEMSTNSSNKSPGLEAHGKVVVPEAIESAENSDSTAQETFKTETKSKVAVSVAVESEAKSKTAVHQTIELEAQNKAVMPETVEIEVLSKAIVPETEQPEAKSRVVVHETLQDHKVKKNLCFGYIEQNVPVLPNLSVLTPASLIRNKDKLKLQNPLSIKCPEKSVKCLEDELVKKFEKPEKSQGNSSTKNNKKSTNSDDKSLEKYVHEYRIWKRKKGIHNNDQANTDETQNNEQVDKIQNNKQVDKIQKTQQDDDEFCSDPILYKKWPTILKRRSTISKTSKNKSSPSKRAKVAS